MFQLVTWPFWTSHGRLFLVLAGSMAHGERFMPLFCIPNVCHSAYVNQAYFLARLDSNAWELHS